MKKDLSEWLPVQKKRDELRKENDKTNALVSLWLM